MLVKRISLYFSLLFISPVLGLIMGVRQSNRDIKRWVLIFFVTLFGSVIFLDESADGFRHQEAVYQHYVDLSLDQFLTEFWEHLRLENNPETNDEPYIHIVSYFVGSVLRLPGLFFIVVAFVYGYFFSGSIFRLFEIFPTWKKHRLFFFYAITFLLWISLYAISTVRTWTGFWVLFYACLSFYQTRKKKYILLMFVPPFIHIGYWVMALPAWIVLVFGNWKWIFSFIFFMSFTVTIVNPTAITQQVEMTEVGASKVKAYSVEKEESSTEIYQSFSSSTWYRRLQKLGFQNWGVSLLSGLLILGGSYFKGMNKLESRMFSIGLLFLTLSNLSWFLYALKNRSAVIGGAFVLASLILLWQRGYFNSNILNIKSQNVILRIVLIFFIPFLFYSVANMIQYFSVFLFFTPFLPWMLDGVNLSIRSFLGVILGLSD